MKGKKKAKNENYYLKIGQTRGRPLVLDAELDLKLRSNPSIVSLCTPGAGKNINVVSGVLMGLVQSNPKTSGKYLNFHVSCSWVRSLYERMQFLR